MKMKNLLSFSTVFISGTILGTLGTLSYPVSHNITNFWPAAAVQTVAGVFFGWWGFTAAITFPVLTNFLTDGFAAHAFGFIPSSIIQTGIPMILVSYFGIRSDLARGKDIIIFALFGVIVPHTLGALWGTFALYLFGGVQSLTILVRTFNTWLLGNIPSALVFGTLSLKILTPILVNTGLCWRKQDLTGGEPTNRSSIFLKIFMCVAVVGVLPYMLFSIYEIIHYHKVVYGKDNPLAIAVGVGFWMSIIIAGFIAKDIITPIKALLQTIKGYRVARSKPKFDYSSRSDEFAYLFEEYDKMITEITNYQRQIAQTAHLAAIGRSTAMVAHDVRRPLASVKALLNVLPSVQNDPERVKKMAAEVDRAITSTNSLLNDIMDFSKDSTVLELGDHGPDSFIIAGIGEALRSHPEAEVKLEYVFGHELTPVHADSQRMIRVLTNIIGNALEAMTDKATGRACGNLFFKTYLAKRDGKEFVGISVADEGPGIPEDALPKLFDPFFTQGKKGGTGLGLAICQKMIDMHGGKIGAKNRDGTRGAEFFVEVPAGEGIRGINHADIIDHSSELKLFREEEAKREDIGDTASTAEFMRINKERGRISTLLVVDDEPLFRETIRSTLNTLRQVKDYVKVIEVDSAETGLKVFEAREFDYVIADIDLGRGKMNGYTFAQKLLQEHPETYVLIHSNKRKAELDEKVRVVASKGDSPPKKRGLSPLRFMGFLSKPMKPSELLQFLACKSFEENVIASAEGAKQSPAHSDVQEIATPAVGGLAMTGKTKTALLLNDDESLIFCFSDDLKKLGYQVLGAKNVSGAMEHFINRKIDMIVSDINLGDFEPTGYDFLNKVREKDTKVPFVFTSGYNRRDEWDKAKGAGATEYLQIPYELHELKKALGV